MIQRILYYLKYAGENFMAEYLYKSPNVKLISETIDHILQFHSSVSRFGDGELMIIIGHGIGFQKADSALKARLVEILKHGSKDNLIVTVPDIFTNGRLALRTAENQAFWRKHLSRHRRDWYHYMNRGQTYYNTAITRFYYPIQDKSKSTIYAALLKKIWENQDILIVEGQFSRLGVGNDLFANVKSLRRILCPAKDAFNQYTEILDVAQREGIGKLILTALGPTATVLAADLSEKGLWAIDIGHVDMEYMWMQHGTTGRAAIKGRVLNEVTSEQNNELNSVEEQDYVKSIITKIG